MRNTIKKKINNQKGITLIALVITIIVLLILAGVAISMLAGDNGILRQAAKAKKDTQTQSTIEQIKLAAIAAMTNEQHTIPSKTKLGEELSRHFGTGYTITGEENDVEWTVTANGVSYIIKNNGNIEKSLPTVTTAPTTKVTEKTKFHDTVSNKTAVIPEGFRVSNKTEEQEIDTGLVVIDDNTQDEYVWIPVPKKTTEITWGVEYQPETTETSYEQIENALHTYTDYYRRNSSGTLTSYKDEWYGKTTSSPDIDTEGCGLSKSEYEEYKQKMLTSIYTNEGFYIGRYEAGIGTYRTNHSVIADNVVPLSKEGQYPLTQLYCSEAQKLASRINVNEYKSSLMFGVQWNCVMVYLEHYGWDSSVAENAVKGYLRSNSKTWGNYYDAEYTLNRGKYAQHNKLTEWKNHNEDLEGIVSSRNKSVQSSIANSILYTTGATNKNSKCKIYDIAGNAYEWTLEKTSTSSYPCTRRGGNYAGSSCCASYYGTSYTTENYSSYRI